MKKVELSKYDFEALDKALSHYIEYNILSNRQEQLKDLFAKAHTGWLEMEDE